MDLTNKQKREARTHAVLMLYQYDIGNFSPEEVKELYREEAEVSSLEVFKAAQELFERTLRNLENIDKTIAKYLKKGWKVERLLPLDRAILRVATEELLNGSFSPQAAIINDAVEIAKDYGEDERSPKFINAILDRISKERCE
ncbi:transcription antitermination factor NusB [Desulfurobacterium atlanticum]|uniref:Transcription antitermination protein NusB n=1 Tax=Desulfurobacterium atlanticum TaxID=240169 RepID=A0A238YBY3_9BACT|nr:transcription antitermination factor NusB [Desulfurobacterium atlanticum]SNR68647.1 NusB antitermination factor [Desulfurobacterium atlanticum]